jgi:flagellar hook-length control protein FliK
MDFAADAVLDAIAPPARSAPARPAAASQEPTFDDHLQAATQESEAPVSEASPHPDQPQKQGAESDTTGSAESLLGAPETAAVQAPGAQTSSPVFVQLIAASTTPAQQAESSPATTPAAPAALNAAAAAQPPAAPQAPAAPHDAPARAAAPAAPSPSSDPAPQKSAEPAEKSAAPAAQPAPSAPSAAQPSSKPTASPSPAATPPAAPPAETAPLATTAVAPAQAQPAQEHAARQPKATRVEAAKTDAASTSDRPAAPSPTVTPRPSAKAAAPQGIAKEAVAVSPLDAPEAAPAQQTSSSAPTAAGVSSAQAQHACAEQVAARAAPVAHQVAREIVRRFENGATRFELRLDPPELGRIEVRLDVSRDHRVTAVIAADSPQALTELARHARDLEHMLQGAGLELTENGLSFDLRQGGERAEAAEFGGAIAENATHVEDAAPVAARPLGFERWRGVRVDMMV